MSRERGTKPRRRRRLPPCVLVMVTCPTLSVAKRLATRVVGRRPAACVNILPRIDSVFRWQGKIDRSRETLLFIKTTGAGVERLRRAVIALHPYEVPEVIALPLVAGSRPYLRWIAASVSSR